MEVLSGSFVVAGSGRVQATKVGAESYARKLASEARRFSLVRSELVEGINTLLRYIQYALFPVAALLLWRQLASNDVEEALVGVVAGVVGMVPEGPGAPDEPRVRDRRGHARPPQRPRAGAPRGGGPRAVDVVCLDKTGTLTEGDVAFDRLEILDTARQAGIGEDDVTEALGALADDENRNATLGALGAAFRTPGWTRDGGVPFSSARKWSAASFDGHGAWVIGAPEMTRRTRHPMTPLRRRADELAAEGRRVLLLGHADALAGEELPGDARPDGARRARGEGAPGRRRDARLLHRRKGSP